VEGRKGEGRGRERERERERGKGKGKGKRKERAKGQSGTYVLTAVMAAALGLGPQLQPSAKANSVFWANLKIIKNLLHKKTIPRFFFSVLCITYLQQNNRK
jgi:hypothetical protein